MYVFKRFQKGKYWKWTDLKQFRQQSHRGLSGDGGGNQDSDFCTNDSRS
jgi:hypothetical protein